MLVVGEGKVALCLVLLMNSILLFWFFTCSLGGWILGACSCHLHSYQLVLCSFPRQNVTLGLLLLAREMHSPKSAIIVLAV